MSDSNSAINFDSIYTNLETVEESSSIILNISSNILKSYTQHLDDLMQDLYSKVADPSTNISDTDLERYYLELTNLVYFMGEKLETVGVKDDISRAAAKEMYNKSYLDTAKSPLAVAGTNGKANKLTVSEITAIAESAAINEQVVNMIFSRVYKQIKFKVDAAFEMIGTLRKIISKRIQEQQLSAGFDNNLGNPNVNKRTRLYE